MIRYIHTIGLITIFLCAFVQAEDTKKVTQRSAKTTQAALPQSSANKAYQQKTQSQQSTKKPKMSPAASSQGESSKVKQLVEDFLKTVQEIPTKDPKKDPSNKQYHEKVEKAYEAYKKLYQSDAQQTVTSDENKKIKQAAKKLFECRNIQNMVWKRNQKGARSTTSQNATQTNNSLSNQKPSGTIKS